MSNTTTDSTYISGSGTCTGSQGEFGKFYFAGATDRTFVKDITNELIKKICNQKAYIYAIDENLTKDNIYGESENKIFKNPILTYCRLEYEQPTQNLNTFGYDTKYSVNIYFYKPYLDDSDIKLKEGDIIRTGGPDNNKTIYFELTSIITDKPLFGEFDNMIMIMAKGTIARKSLIDVLSRIQI